MESTIPHESDAATAAVNAVHIVVLYAPDGEAIRVESPHVEKWLRRGFTRTPNDLPTLLSDVTAQAASLDAPWRAYAAACEAAGHLDSAAQEVAQAALEAFAQACNRLHLALHATYTPVEVPQE